MHGKPLIVVPHGRDQNDNAVRVTARGAGIMLPATSAAWEFRTAIEYMLADVRYAEAARTLGDKIGREVQDSPVAAELERLAGRGSQRRRAA
jgi:UDP:flavonoid glycosyltransferase YjiC (YdhE family)